MNIIIDLELNQVVQGWGNRNPTSPISVKSQDTPVLAIYFGKGQTCYDLGAGPGVRFALYVAGSPNALVDITGFTRNVDSQNKVAYVAYPNFNTTQMQAAMAGLTTLVAIGEIRYQTPFGTIARTLDIPFTVNRSLLQESAYDTTTAAFTVPAVGSSVTLHINHTGWLAPNQNITIGAGGGAYQVVSVTNPTDFVAKNLGGTANAAAGIVIPTGTSVGNTPTSALGVYPDPSTIELLIHKNQPNGYAGLNGASKLFSSTLPVDGQTVVLDTNGNLAAGSILAYTSANFTTPAANGTVAVTLNSTANLHAGQYVRIPIAGYYQVTVITDGTHATVENMGDPLNAISGTTITSGAALLPAQAVSGGGGGTPGQNAYTSLTAGFVVPAVGATVSLTVGSTAWMPGSGYALFIGGAGYYLVNSITDSTHVVVTNSGSAANQPPGTNVASGGTVSGAGPQGAPGATGASLSAYDALTAAFTQPAMNATVTATISNTAWLSANQIIYIAGGGYYQVATVVNATTLSITNLPYPGNASAGAVIALGSKVSPAGLIGPAGAGGPGLNAFTTLTSNFTQPALNASVTIAVGTTAWMAQGQGIFIQGGGYYSISSVSDLTHGVVTNLGGSSNVAQGSTVTGSGTQTVSPAGINGIPGVNAFTVTTAGFTQPTSGSTVTVAVGNTGWMAQGQNLYIPGAGYYSVSVVSDATHVVLINSGTAGNAGAGNTVASGSQVSPAGATGLTGAVGPQGPQGPAGSGGGGGGGMLDPSTGVELFDDFTSSLTLGTPAIPFGTLGWVLAQDVGTTANVNANLSFGAETDNVVGIYSLVSQSTGTTGLARYTIGAPGGSGISALRRGALTIEWRIKIVTLQAAANYADWKFGINATTTANAVWNAVYFEYNANVSPNWYCVNGDGGTYTSSNSGVAVSTSYVRLRFEIDAGWTTITFKINGTVVSTSTTHIPLAGTGDGWLPIALVGLRAGATTYQTFLDYFYGKYLLTR